MFEGIKFDRKVVSTMNAHFDYNYYQFPKTQKAVFRSTCKEVRTKGGNEYDAVCVFMAKIADSILKPEEHREMIETWMGKVRDMIPQLSSAYAQVIDQTYDRVMEKVS